jgi:hypothetical protein
MVVCYLAYSSTLKIETTYSSETFLLSTYYIALYSRRSSSTEFTEFFWTFSIVRYSKKTRRFGNWICFRPQVKVEEKTPTQLGPLERLRLVFSSTFTWGRKQIEFPKRRAFWNTGQWKKSRKILWILYKYPLPYLATFSFSPHQNVIFSFWWAIHSIIHWAVKMRFCCIFLRFTLKLYYLGKQWENNTLQKG